MKRALAIGLSLLASPGLANHQPKSHIPAEEKVIDAPFPKAKETFEQAFKILLENYHKAGLTEEQLYLAATRGLLTYV